MRFLYGDSLPFPPQYDFLAALDVFSTQAAKVVRIDAEARNLRKAADAAAAARTHAVNELDTFHREAVAALQDGGGDGGELVQGYVRQVSELAQRLVEDAKRTATTASEREQLASRAEDGRHRAESRDALEKILTTVRLVAMDTRLRMAWTPGSGSASSNETSGTFTFEGALVATLTLASDVDEWRAPRRIGDLAQGLTLPVGVRRSLFKRTVAPETISLDDYLLGGFDLQTDQAELRLRKKPELADSLVFMLRRVDDRVEAEVHYPGDAEAESGLPTRLDLASANEMERLWQVVRTVSRPLIGRKKQLVTLTLAGVDVFEQNLATEVVGLVVAGIAPIVTEVARRSPNIDELSLKVENENGRREEIYVKKGQLVSALESVPLPDRNVFEPLGLLPAHAPSGSFESVDVLLEGAPSARG